MSALSIVGLVLGGLFIVGFIVVWCETVARKSSLFMVENGYGYKLKIKFDNQSEAHVYSPFVFGLMFRYSTNYLSTKGADPKEIISYFHKQARECTLNAAQIEDKRKLLLVLANPKNAGSNLYQKLNKK